MNHNPHYRWDKATHCHVCTPDPIHVPWYTRALTWILNALTQTGALKVH